MQLTAVSQEGLLIKAPGGNQYAADTVKRYTRVAGTKTGDGSPDELHSSTDQ